MRERERDKERDSKSLKVITRFNLQQHCPASPSPAKATGRAAFGMPLLPPALETLLGPGCTGCSGMGGLGFRLPVPAAWRPGSVLQGEG